METAMANEQLLSDEVNRLCEAAIRIKQVEPWTWMKETDIFGIQDPNSDEIGFVSVMGSRGEHFSVAIYLGTKALHDFWTLQSPGPLAFPERVIEIRQLQASFEDRKALTKRDYDLIKQSGLKFRGRKSWPRFRSYISGFWPWYLEPQEARFLIHGLEQTLEVTRRIKDNPAILDPAGDESYLVRVPSANRRGRLEWKDRILSFQPEPLTISLQFDEGEFEALRQMPQKNYCLEMDFFLFPADVGKLGERPACPYALLVMESSLNVVLHSDMLLAKSSLEDMWGEIPGHLVSALAKAGFRPRQIVVRSELLVQLLQPLAEELGFELILSHKFKVLDRAKEEMFEFMGP
jgi:Domain of unknown function (DUF6930)